MTFGFGIKLGPFDHRYIRHPQGHLHHPPGQVHHPPGQVHHPPSHVQPPPPCGCKESTKWVVIPDLNTHCIEEVGKFVVTEYNKQYRENYNLKVLYAGWYSEVDENTVKYRLHIEVANCFGRVFKYEAIVLEKSSECGRTRTLQSCKLV